MTTALPRSRRTRLIVGGALVVIAVAGIIYAVLAIFGGNEPGSGPGYRFATVRHVNQEGGYSFHHPPGWEVEDDQTVSQLAGPRGETRVTFGLGAEGDAEAAETRFVREIQGQYRDVELAAIQIERVGPNPALSVAGTGRVPGGPRIRFLAITVSTPEQNYSIGVFTAANTDPGEVLPPTQEVVNSFRPLPRAEV
ncbi:MAG: hypothetical protein ACRDI0_00845 [Actinomycetota bacterium]